MQINFNIFNPQNSINTNNSVSKQNKTNFMSNVFAPKLQPLKQDIVSFTGFHVNHKDLLEHNDKWIILACKKALKEGIKIGEGQEAIAYKMQDYPNYCIRQEKKITKGTDEELSLDKTLNKYDEVNHVVAKLNGYTQLMKYISGIPLKIMPHRDTKDGMELKKIAKGLVANNFTEAPFKKVIEQIENAKFQDIDFDRRGENLHVDLLSQEMTCIDFSPNFKDIEYNPISYIYSSLDVDGTEHAGKIFGKLCKAYADRLLEVPVKRLNLEHLDTNFYHRGFEGDAFNLFPDRDLLAKTTEKLNELIEMKKDPELNKDYYEYCIYDFKEFIDDSISRIRKKTFYDMDYSEY